MPSRPLAACVYLAAAASASIASAQEEPPAVAEETSPEFLRPQRLDVEYRFNLSHKHHLDRVNVTGISVGAMDALHLGLQDDGSDPALARVFKWGVSIWVGSSVVHMAHEYGHLSVFSKLGEQHPVYGDPAEDPSTWGDLNPVEVFLDGLLGQDGIISIRPADWAELEQQYQDLPNEWRRLNLALEGGGFNQEQLLVSRYATRIRDGECSYLDTTGLLWAAFGIIRYPTGGLESDLEDYSNLLSEGGFDASPESIKWMSALRLVSGSGLAALYGFAAGLFTGKGGTLSPISFEAGDDVRVFWPEIETYLTQVGPTVRVSVPVRVGAVEFLPSAERSFASGLTVYEAGLSVRLPITSYLRAEGGVWAGSEQKGLWGSGTIALLPLPWLAVTVGLETGADYTFRRDIYGSGNDILDPSEFSLFLGLRLGASF